MMILLTVNFVHYQVFYLVTLYLALSLALLATFFEFLQHFQLINHC